MKWITAAFDVLLLLQWRYFELHFMLMCFSYCNYRHLMRPFCVDVPLISQWQGSFRCFLCWRTSHIAVTGHFMLHFCVLLSSHLRLCALPFAVMMNKYIWFIILWCLILLQFMCWLLLNFTLFLCYAMSTLFLLLCFLSIHLILVYRYCLNLLSLLGSSIWCKRGNFCVHDSWTNFDIFLEYFICYSWVLFWMIWHVSYFLWLLLRVKHFISIVSFMFAVM